MSVAAILSIPLALSLETIPQTITAHAYMSCAYMIIVATFLAFQLQTLAQNIQMHQVRVFFYVQNPYLRMYLDFIVA